MICGLVTNLDHNNDIQYIGKKKPFHTNDYVHFQQTQFVMFRMENDSFEDKSGIDKLETTNCVVSATLHRAMEPPQKTFVHCLFQRVPLLGCCLRFSSAVFFLPLATTGQKFFCAHVGHELSCESSRHSQTHYDNES